MSLRILALSDLHVGSSVGLWPESVIVGEGNALSANSQQRWLLRCWNAMIEEARSLRPDVVVLNGDLLQGVHHNDGQLMSTQVGVQQRAAVQLLEPLTGPVTGHGGRIYVIAGTEYHDGAGAADADVLASMIGARQSRETGRHARWELLYRLGEASTAPVIHFAHHIGIAASPDSEASSPVRDLRTEVGELYQQFAGTAPNVKMIVRSHRHRFVYVQIPYDQHALVLPGWQLKTAYAYKKAAPQLPQIGYAWIEWDGTDITVRPRLYKLPGIAVDGGGRGDD